jgi:cation/acetate symporter
MVMNLVIAFVVSRFTAPPPAEIQEIVESVRLPSGVGEAHVH